MADIFKGGLPRAVNLHSFFADPDPAVFLNADPDPAFKKIKKKTHEELTLVVKTLTVLKRKKQWSLCKFTLKIA